MDFLKELLGRCVGKTAPVHKKNLEKASVSNFMDKIGVVDLGLPSGVLWATENLGISSVVLLKFWYIYVSKFEETFICKREIDALPPIIRFAVFILLTEPSRIPLFNLLAIELLMAE